MPMKLPNLAINPEGLVDLRREFILVNASASCLGSTRCKAAFLSASSSTFMSMRCIIIGKENPQPTANRIENTKVAKEGKNK